MNLEEFIIDFHDHLAPHLDTYEQAIYLYAFRHSRLIGNSEAVIGFKSARARMACGVGEKGKPMSEQSAYKKLRSLSDKGCVEIIATERFGHRIRLKLPREIPGVVVESIEAPPISLDEMDFFEVAENRALILERENHYCFYCLRAINGDNYVIRGGDKKRILSTRHSNTSQQNGDVPVFYQKCLFANARPEPVFKYCSNADAR